MSHIVFLARMARQAAFAFAALPLVFAVNAAEAHARLVKATPAAGSAVASISEIRIEFSEPIEPRFSGLTLTGSNGAAAALGEPKTEAGNKSVLIAPINAPLPPGVYTVHWHAVSVDTHRTQGDFSFTVKP